MAYRGPAKFEIFYDRELVNKVKKGISDFLFGSIGTQTKYQKRKIPKRKGFSAKTKKITLNRQNGRCIRCGDLLEFPEFHHKDGNRSNNDASNCEALCPNCHAKKTRKRKKLFW